MSSEPPHSASGRAKWNEELPHKSEFKPSAKPVSSVRNAPPTTTLLTAKEAANYLRVSLSWLAKARMRGDGPPYIRVGRSIRYAEAALIQWMKSRQRLSTSEQ
jgi:excisionase family DNA binding protein